MDYSTFLQSKRIVAPTSGIEGDLQDINPTLFPFQRALVRWALQKGRAALFADCGLGKTFCQLAWAHIVHQHTGGDILILAPLAVASQTVAEGEKLGIAVHICRSQSDVRPGLNIANYEMLEHFDASHFVGIVLDESSILKSYMGKTKRALVDAFAHTPYRLCCTATPAPNDVMEIGNHSEFLGIMPSSEMLMRWFINDTMSNGHYRLKGHATKDFWEWVSSWAISLRKPSDLGYSDDGFMLPDLQITHCYVQTDITVGVEQGQLFRAPVMNATNLHKEMRITAADRAQAVADMVNASHGILTLTGNCDKLAICHGRKNTPNNGVQNINQTPKSGQKESLKDEHLKRIRNTCIPTTKQTKSDSISTEESTSTNVIGDDESGTQATLNTVSECAQKCASTTQTTPHKSEIPDYAMNLALAPSNTTNSLSNKTGNALSVEQSLQMDVSTDCMSIIATQQEQCEGSFAPLATWESANSETNLTSYSELPTTSSENQKPEPWVIWCNTNYEQEELDKHFGDRAFSVYGSQSPIEKERRILGWLRGERPILISKPSICGLGLNFQHCHRTVFVGLSYSFEGFYQAVRRLYRFGQKHPVEVTIVAAVTESPLVAALERKIHAHMQMSEAMNASASQLALQEGLTLTKYNPQVPMVIPDWVTKEI